MPDASPPPDIQVVRVAAESWPDYREVRLAMLADSPRAFSTTYAEVAARTDEDWQVLAEQLTIWLAYADRGPIGSVAFWADPQLGQGAGYLVGMWVHPDHRGCGTAHALAGALIAHARGEGVHTLVLDVVETNERAYRFYKRLGFRPTGRSAALSWDSSISESELALDLT
ncbi:MAG: GNAT family N-acetyltransferase [Nostocoides sp.]